MPDLTVVAANLHNERDAANWLRARSRRHRETFDVALVSEAQRRRAILAGAPGHRYHTGPKGMGDNNAGRETGIMVANRLPDLGGGSYFLSDIAPRFERVGKERWGQVRVTEVGDTRVALIGLHPVAAPGVLNDPGEAKHALVRRYREAISWLDATITSHRAQDHEVIVGGDLNMWVSWQTPWAPIHVFRAHSMVWHWHRVDAIVWTRGLSAVRQSRHDIGSDHDALRVELSVNRKKRR